MSAPDTDLRTKIIIAIRDNDEPMDSAGLRALPAFRHEDAKMISNRLFALKQDGLIVASERGRYEITAKGRAAIGGEPQPNRRGRKPVTAPELVNGGAIERILIEAEANAQGALDAYLATVGAAAILVPLRTARDAAREALRNYRSGK